MIVGYISIVLAFCASLVAAAAYFYYYRSNNNKFLSIANSSYTVMSIAVFFAIGLLLSQIWSYNFQLNYVYSHSSRALPWHFVFSTLWAGQEGTFLMWTAYSSIFGFILIRKTVRKNPLVLFFLVLTQFYILLILLGRDPFLMVWEVRPDIPVGFVPADGAGLNPLLQNPWMRIHPPTLFVGYASTAIPFTFAMSAMVRKDFTTWIIEARRWILFTVLILGTGVMMGGYWAYTTLGWGGYWGWDPVENASIIPWIFSVVMLHGTMIQSRQKGLVRSNLVFAGLAYISMLWGSFLTRSGVLGDFSVHSFAASDLNIYLICYVGLFLFMFLGLYIYSTRGIRGTSFADGILNRESFILFGMTAFLFSGIFTFIGTSAPFFTALVNKPAGVSIEFYETIHMPIALLLMASVSFAPLLAWKVNAFRNIKRLNTSLIISFFITTFAVIVGLNQPISILLFFLSVFAIIINGWVVYEFIKKKPSKMGGYLAHVGLGFMVIGIITSAMYDRSEKIALPKDQFQKTSFGYDIKFVGFREMPDGKDRAQLVLKSENEEFTAEMQFYFSEYTNSYMLNPYIKLKPLKDLYISPISFVPAEDQNSHQLSLAQGQTGKFSDIAVTFNGFEVNQHGEAQTMIVKANLTVEVPDGSYSERHDLAPEYKLENGKFSSTIVDVPGRDGVSVKIASVDASNRTVHLEFNSTNGGIKGVDYLGIEVSEKPFISLLWFGILVLMSGVIVTITDRKKKAKV